VPDELVNATAETSGTSPTVVLDTMALAGKWLVTMPTLEAGVAIQNLLVLPSSEIARLDTAEVARVAESIAGNFHAFAEVLRATQATVVPSSEIRVHWADFLERVRTGGEIIDITHHGERAAALVPPYVADFYRDAEDKADAEAIDQVLADREAGEESVPFEDLMGELGL
jgi:prevent-host-death family protein